VGAGRVSLLRITGVTQDTDVVRGDGFPLTETVVNRFLVIGPGSGNDYVVVWGLTTTRFRDAARSG
jgi:hypothetical protein